MEISWKKTILAYAIAIFAGIIALLLALDLRIVVLTIYAAIISGGIPWHISLINAVSMIILMTGWVIYIFYTQYFFEKKCEPTKAAFLHASLKLVLPIVVLYASAEIFLKISG